MNNENEWVIDPNTSMSVKVGDYGVLEIQNLDMFLASFPKHDGKTFHSFRTKPLKFTFTEYLDGKKQKSFKGESVFDTNKPDLINDFDEKSKYIVKLVNWKKEEGQKYPKYFFTVVEK